MAQSQRTARKIERLKADLLIVEKWLANNEAGISNHRTGTLGIGYLDPIRAMELKRQLEDELTSLMYPGGRFKRVVPMR